MDSAAFQKATGVSRETLDRLETYHRLLKKWQKAINLVGPKTVADAWARHFLDSAQLYEMAPERVRTGVWLDMGAGAGFPGLVIAILGAKHVHLVESDLRKATFQREVIRATGAPATVHAVRMETLQPFPVDVITARAFAPLEKLLEMAYPFWGEDVVGLFPKGRDVELELTQATKYWKMSSELLESRTDKDARILRIDALSRADHQ
jgi:16S rRNA (guanine527-N7)-methyltransferase